MERVTGIGCIFFKARDPKQMMAWYNRHLDIGASDNTEETYTEFTWRDPDNPQLPGSTVWSLFPHDTRYFYPSTSSFMVNYRVADLDALLAQLRAEGVQVEERVEEYEYGRFGWITDPEGNRIQLWEPPKGTAGRHSESEEG